MQQPRFQRIVDVEAQVVELAVAAEHFGLAAGVELDPATRLQRLAGAYLRPRLVARLQALDQDLDPPAAPGLAAEQPRRDHPGVVEHQQVALAQQRRQIAYRSEEHTSELQSLMRISYAVFCLKKKNK